MLKRRGLPGRGRLVAVGGAAICALASVGTATVRPAGAATLASSVTVPPANRISGVDLQTYNDTTMSPDFAKIAADGANMVNITVWWEVPDSSSNAIVPAGMTMSDVNVINLAQSAEAAGLQVSLTPDFVVGSNGWRGQYDPPDPAAFFSNYTQMLDHYATIAQQLHMPMFWVGSEMIDSEKYTAQWESAIASVRQIYSGKLLYDVNWSTTGNVKFYGALDAISLSAYYPLSNQANPTENQLLAAWHGANPDNGNWFAAVVALEQRWQKPLYFGEAGYSFSTYAAEAPYTESYQSSDPGLQYRCYEALDATFRSQPWWGGVLWWAWDGGVYNMDGEPAESLIGVKSVAYPTAATPPASGPASPAGSSGATGGSSSGSYSHPAGASVTPGEATSPSVGSSPSGTSGAVPVGVRSGSAPSTPSIHPAGSTSNSPAAAGETAPMKLQAAGNPARSPSGIRTALVVAGIAVIVIVMSWLYTARRRRRIRPAPAPTSPLGNHAQPGPYGSVPRESSRPRI